MSAVGAVFGGTALGLWWLARRVDADSRIIAGAPTVRGGDLSASLIRGIPPLPRDEVHVYGTVTGPDGAGPIDPDNTAILFVKTRLRKAFDCSKATKCEVRLEPVWQEVETLPVFELQQDLQLSDISSMEGQALSSPVVRKIVAGGAMGPYRGANLKERVRVDGTALQSLERVFDADKALRVDTQSFKPASGDVPNDATIADYIDKVPKTGSVDHIPPQHQNVTLGEVYLERSLNIGDQLNAVGLVQPSGTRGVALLIPRYVGFADKHTMAAALSSDLSTFLTAAATTSAVIAAVTQLGS